MKKGKVLATLSMLVLTIACLTFGVFAIISTSFTAKGTITFNAYNLDIDLEISATGTSTAFTTLYYSTTPSRTKHSSTDKTWQAINASTTVSGLSLDFDELGGSGNFETQLKMKITNYSDYAIKATATATAVSGIDTSVENVAFMYKNVTETMDSGQTAPEAHSDTVVVHFTPTSSSTAASGAFNVNMVIEPSEYQEDDPSTYEMNDYADPSMFVGYTGTKDYLVIPRVVRGYNVTSVMPGTVIDISSIQEQQYNGATIYRSDGDNYGRLEKEWKGVSCTPSDEDEDGNPISFQMAAAEFPVGEYELVGDYATNYMLPNHINNSTYYGTDFWCDVKIKTLIFTTSLVLGDGCFSGVSTTSENLGYYQDESFSSDNEAEFISSIVDGAVDPNGLLMLNSAFSDLEKVVMVRETSAETMDISQQFSLCNDLVSITMPDSIISIGDDAFHGCSKLTTISIPSSVTSIGEQAFYGCSSLSSITMPDSITSIGDYAFRGSSKLTTITIPSSIISIGENAFSNCTELTGQSINSETNVKYLGYTDDDGNFVPTVLYKASSALSGAYSIPNTCKVIYCSAFYYCSKLTSITIPNSVTNIGSHAFNGCSKLSSITIPNSVTSIGYRAFLNCSALNSAEFKNATGWKVGTTSTDCNTAVTISTTGFSANATLLKSTHLDKYWKRG